MININFRGNMRIILILLFIGNILIASIDKENNANFQKVYDKSELFLKDKFKDIATELKISENSAKVTYHNAIKSLKKHLEREYE